MIIDIIWYILICLLNSYNKYYLMLNYLEYFLLDKLIIYWNKFMIRSLFNSNNIKVIIIITNEKIIENWEFIVYDLFNLSIYKNTLKIIIILITIFILHPKIKAQHIIL